MGNKKAEVHASLRNRLRDLVRHAWLIIAFEKRRDPHISELDSHSVDALQAADIAAGFARDLIDSQGVRDPINHFAELL